MVNYITTARKPSVRTRTFAKQLSFLFGADYITRGKTSISDLIADARYKGVEYVLIVTEKDGNPKQLLVMLVNDKTWEWRDSYFVKILRTRSEISKQENVRIRSFSLQTKDLALNHLLNQFDLKLNDDSDYAIKDIKNGISVFFEKKEIGPSFAITFANDRIKEE